jgi:nucleoside 2-deoxyribosyltransferase
MALPKECFLCDQPGAKISQHFDTAAVECPRCGRYQINEEAAGALEVGYKDDRYRLSGVTRSASDRGQPLVLQRHNIDDLIKSAPTLRTPFDALDRLLLVIRDHMISLTGGVRLLNVDYPLVFARNFAEFRDLVNLLETQGWITTQRRLDTPQGPGWECRLTLEGWKHIAELRRVGRVSDQAFVAMWFSPELLPAWSEGIEPALNDAGYSPVRVDRVEYNEKIDDRIIAEIRRSGLVVADFTGDRGGVYYEAGFAQGLGLPVIFTVRKDDINRVHFDTRQYNHIAWETVAELRERLHYRVMATLGPGQKKSAS